MERLLDRPIFLFVHSHCTPLQYNLNPKWSHDTVKSKWTHVTETTAVTFCLRGNEDICGWQKPSSSSDCKRLSQKLFQGINILLINYFLGSDLFQSSGTGPALHLASLQMGK